MGTDLGVVLTPMNAEATACFDASCALPADLCIRHEGDVARMYRCSTGLFADENVWEAPSTSDTSAVVIMGRIVRATRNLSPPPSSAAVPLAKRAQVGPDPAVSGFKVPKSPPIPCKPNFAMREPSNKQVDEGNAAVVASDIALALKKYRAAITINQCNAYAWAAVGQSLVNFGAPDKAVRPLQAATQLMPTHHVAWTNLGRASELSGDREGAQAAYEKAVQIKPGHAPAAEGLQRTRQ